MDDDKKKPARRGPKGGSGKGPGGPRRDGPRKPAGARPERSGGDTMFDELAKRLDADVMFRTGRAELDPQATLKLAELGRMLGAHSTIRVQLHGFADPRGNPEDNLRLSMERADAVRQALIDGGASPEQILVYAHGEDLTTAPEGDLEAYAWERRVTLAIGPTSNSVVARAE